MPIPSPTTASRDIFLVVIVIIILKIGMIIVLVVIFIITIIVVSMLTPEPSKEVQELVEHVRYPNLEGDINTLAA